MKRTALCLLLGLVATPSPTFATEVKAESSACALALSPSPQDALEAYSTLVRIGLERKILDADMIEVALLAAEQGQIVNLFEGKNFSSRTDGFKNAVQKVLKLLSPEQMVNVLRPLYSRSVEVEKASVIAQNKTLKILGLDKISEDEAAVWAQLEDVVTTTAADGRTLVHASKYKDPTRAFAFDLAAPQALMPISKPENAVTTFNQAGEQILATRDKNEGVEIRNVSTGQLLYEEKNPYRLEGQTQFYQNRKNKTFAFDTSGGQTLDLSLFDIEDPTTIYKTSLKVTKGDFHLYARDGKLIQLTNGDDAFIFSVHRVISVSLPPIVEIYLWRFKNQEAPEFLEEIFNQEVVLFDSVQGGGALTLSNSVNRKNATNSIEVIPADPRLRQKKSWIRKVWKNLKNSFRSQLYKWMPLRSTAQQFYWVQDHGEFHGIFNTDNGHAYGLFKKINYLTHPVFILVDMNDLRRHETLPLNERGTLRSAIVFQNRRGQRILAYQQNSQDRTAETFLRIKNLDSPESRVPSLNLKSIKALPLRYLRSGDVERIVAGPNENGQLRIFDLEAAPAQAEVQP